MDQHFIKRIVEAALLAANHPLTVVQLNALFPLDEPAPDGSIVQALEALQADCAERGVELVEVASGWRFQVQSDVHAWVARLWTERQTKYTRATLETLALVAYRQPITRGEIEQVRGVAVNSNIIKALEEREWIRVVGHRDVPGRPELLGTTKTFLDYFGLKRLDELPALSELKDFAELDPQLQFDGKPAEPAASMPIGDIAFDDDGHAASNDDDLAQADADAGHADIESDDRDDLDQAATAAGDELDIGTADSLRADDDDDTDTDAGAVTAAEPTHDDESQDESNTLPSPMTATAPGASND